MILTGNTLIVLGIGMVLYAVRGLQARSRWRQVRLLFWLHRRDRWRQWWLDIGNHGCPQYPEGKPW